MKLENEKTLNINGKKLKIAIILPYFNETLGLALLENTIEELKRNKVEDKNMIIVRVAGALEIPLACKKIIKKEKLDAIIALGIVIKGETTHYDLVSSISYNGLMQVQLESEIPISFGILCCNNIEQVKERIDAKRLNKGKEFAQSVLIQTVI